MRPTRLDLDPATADLTGFLSNATGTSGTLTANDSGDSLAHQVTLRNDTANDKSGIAFTLTGTDADGQAQTETMDGPAGGATVASGKYFLTLSTVVWDSTLGTDTVDIGWNNQITSNTIVLDHFSSNSASAQVLVTGTIDFDIEVTLENPIKNTSEQTAPFTYADQNDLAWLNDGNFTGKTASLLNTLSITGLRAMRVTTNSYSAAAELQVWITQPRGNK